VDVFKAISDEGTIERSSRAQSGAALFVGRRRAQRDPRHGPWVPAGCWHAHFNPKQFAQVPQDFEEGEVLRVAHFLRTRHRGGVTVASDVDCLSRARVPDVRCADGRADGEAE
jgi:hypothetical protein